tara:strand:+ start:13823 stop:15031 length:1209 start_codon:yes stop_codon:yes gene_type:complete
MEKPFRFRYVSEIAGFFVLLAAVLLVVGIVLSGQAQGWFEPRRVIRVVLEGESTNDVKPGTDVKIMGSRAGTVERIEFREKSRAADGTITTKTFDPMLVQPINVEIVAVLKVKGDWIAFVGSDSIANLKYDWGGFGAPYFDISRGTNAVGASDELYLRLEKKENIEAAVERAVNNISITTVKVGELADSFNKQDGDLKQALASLREIADKASMEESVIGLLVNDNEAALRMKATLENFETASADVSKSVTAINDLLSGMKDGESGIAGALFNDENLANQLKSTITQIEKATMEVNESLSSLPSMLNATDKAVNQFTEVAVVMQKAIEEYELLGQALQQHWLVRKQVKNIKEDEVSPQQTSASTAKSSGGSDSGSANVKAKTSESGASRPTSSGLRLPFRKKK